MAEKSVMGRRLQTVADITEALQSLAEKAHSEVLDVQTLEKNWENLPHLDFQFVASFAAAIPPEVLADALLNISPTRFALIKQVVSWAEKKRTDETK